jgi:hypothetical protein
VAKTDGSRTALIGLVALFVLATGITWGTAPSEGATQLKPPIQGLLDRGGFPPAQYDAVVHAFVANVHWSDIQTRPGGAIVRGNVVDQALAAARTYNAANPQLPQMHVKLRLMAGIWAPDWAKSLEGFKPVVIQSLQPGNGAQGDIGPFWTAAYALAYADLQTRLAAVYVGDPLLNEVTISRCMTIYAEPFQRDDTNFAALYAQGYNVGDDKSCLRHEVDAHTVWTTTRSSLSFNSYRPWVRQPDGTYAQGTADETFAASVMSYCRSTLGNRCTIENNSIRSGYIGMDATPNTLYYDIKKRGPAITFQTATPGSVGDLHATIRWAIAMGANAVELPGYEAAELLAADEQGLLGNPYPG